MTEFELITFLTKNAPRQAPDLVRGCGDDCAVIQKDADNFWLITTDALTEGVHFRREWLDFKTIGRKAISVNLSDIAAMGGEPRFYLVSIGLPPKDVPKAAWAIYSGMDEIASRHGTILIGGDTWASPQGIVISVTAIGEIEKETCLFRSGARAGDAIYVTGTVGSSALGLACLKAGKVGGDWARFTSRHNAPVPRVAEGQKIAKTGMATAMIDISDGLIADIQHIADESKVGFEINASKVPTDEGFSQAACDLANPMSLALTGGEDYELLFTVAASLIADFEAQVKTHPTGCGITRIGTIVANSKTRIVSDDNGRELKLETAGFDHFQVP